MIDHSQIFINEEFRLKLQEQTSNLSSSLIIYSAFIKTSALEWLAKFIPDDIQIEVVARWQPNDLLSNASDLNSYQFCVDRGWKFGIQSSLHSKVFIFDDSKVLLGSANLTDRGLSISREGNLEVGTVIDASITDLDKLQLLKDETVWLNDDIYNEINTHILNIKIDKPKFLEWSDSLKEKLEKPISFLWINELMWSDPKELLSPDLNNSDHAHDIELLDLDVQYLSKELLDQKFISSNIYKFVLKQLYDSSNQYTNFGWVSSILHDAILDDPPPYRSSIKHYVRALFLWLEWSNLSKIKLKQYEHTIGLYIDDKE